MHKVAPISGPVHKQKGPNLTLIIVWTNLVVPEYQMLHTKFQGHQPFGFERDFLNVFTIYGHGGHLGYVTKPCEVTSIPPSHESTTWNLASIGLAVIEEKKV